MIIHGIASTYMQRLVFRYKNINLFYWRVVVVGNHDVAGKGYVQTENSQIASVGANFGST